jgi:hypothetical protein
MSPKRQDDLFPTTALVPLEHQFSTTLASSVRTRSLDKAERWIVGESHKQQLVIHEQQHKTEVAQQAIATIHERGFREFTAAADDIWEMRTPNGRDPELQRHIDHVAAQTIQSAGGSIHAVTRRSAELILEQTGNSLYRETSEHKGLLARLRGETE